MNPPPSSDAATTFDRRAAAARTSTAPIDVTAIDVTSLPPQEPPEDEEEVEVAPEPVPVDRRGAGPVLALARRYAVVVIVIVVSLLLANFLGSVRRPPPAQSSPSVSVRADHARDAGRPGLVDPGPSGASGHGGMTLAGLTNPSTAPSVSHEAGGRGRGPNGIGAEQRTGGTPGYGTARRDR